MDLPASLKNLREFFSKHKFIYSIFLFFFYLIIFHYLLALVYSISGFLAKMNASWLFPLYPSSSFLVTATIYIRIVLEIELLAVFAISIASLLKSTIQILLSDAGDKRTELSFKDRLSRVTESAKCLLFTWFYVRFLKLGYIFVGILAFLPQILNNKIQELSDISTFFGTNTILVVLALLGTLLYSYLAVGWNLALAVSIREDKSGIEAFRRAAELAEEMKLKLKLTGLFLNILFGVSSVMIFVFHNECMASNKEPVADAVQDTKNLFVVVVLNEVYTWVCYRVLHLGCKKNREDVSLEHDISPQHQPLIGDFSMKEGNEI